MKVKIQLVFIIVTLLSTVRCDIDGKVIRQKRQIYREQVLPHAGGKIPDTAFNIDRLALNRLQKEGIAIPDGVSLEQRPIQVYQYLQRSKRPVLHVKSTPDNRYTPSEGRSYYKEHPTIETTYLLPQIWTPSHSEQQSHYNQAYKPNQLTQLDIHHPIQSSQQLNQNHPFTAPLLNVNPDFELKDFGVSSGIDGVSTQLPDYYQNSWTPQYESYITTQIFNDFESFFNNFNQNSEYNHHLLG